MTVSIVSLLERLEQWLEEAHDRPVHWNEPATPEQIDALEETLGVALPVEIRHWLRVHDGQPRVSENPPVLPDDMLFLSCKDIADEWSSLLEFADDLGVDGSQICEKNQVTPQEIDFRPRSSHKTPNFPTTVAQT